MSNGESWDLFKLFTMVKEKGGYDAVCKNRLWDLVGEECGLGVNVGSSVELVCTKHFSALEECLKNVADGKLPECGSVDDRDRVEFCKRLMEAQTESLSNDYGEEETGDESDKACDSLEGRKLCGTNMVKGLNSISNVADKDKTNGHIIIDLDMLDHGTDLPIPGKSCNSNIAKDVLEVVGQNKIVTVDAFDAENNMLKLSDGSKTCDDDDDDNSDDVLILDPSDVNRETFGHRRKRQSVSEMLSWVISIAKNPFDPAVSSIPEMSKWKYYGSQEIWKQILLFREAAFLTVNSFDAESNIPKLSDGSKSCDNDNDNNNNNSDECLKLDMADVDQESCGRKRKRESESEMLSWITSIAKNPCDPAVGSVPEMSKWTSYGNQEIWKQILLFRKAAFLNKDFETVTEQLSSQGQKFHPSKYDDPDHRGVSYNLRERLKCSKEPFLEKSASDQVGYVPVGPKHQAEVPEWTGMTYESDSKWLGTRIWPTVSANSKQVLVERDPIGKGRQDSCGCQVQGSVECVRFHISMKSSKLKLELGEAFYQWNLHKIGEQVRDKWTQQEEKKFKDVVKSKSASFDKCFWDILFKTFPKKSREDLVSYYFNVFILQLRAYQNRHTPCKIDSDDDGSDFISLKRVFGHYAPASSRM